MPGRVLGENSRPIACPTCGADDRLLLGMDLDDRSEAPSYMSCGNGHSWAEKGMPRRLGALLLAEVLDLDPSLFGRLDELQDAHGGDEPWA
jgi:hypothetical protein